MSGILFFVFMIVLLVAIIAAVTWYKYATWKYDRDLKHQLEQQEQKHQHEMEQRTRLYDRGAPQSFLYREPDDANVYPPMEQAQPGAYEGIYPYQPPQPLG